MDERDLVLRNRTYAAFVELGRPPQPGELLLGDEEDVLAGWRRLHDAHALVLDGSHIRMLNPFSVVQTPHRVHARGRWWYANCAWDAFGVLAALHEDGRIETSCPDCAEPIGIDVVGGKPQQEAVAHFGVPARRWWDDIVFT